jgi:hypothetical protein
VVSDLLANLPHLIKLLVKLLESRIVFPLFGFGACCSLSWMFWGLHDKVGSLIPRGSLPRRRLPFFLGRSVTFSSELAPLHDLVLSHWEIVLLMRCERIFVNEHTLWAVSCQLGLIGRLRFFLASPFLFSVHHCNQTHW